MDAVAVPTALVEKDPLWLVVPILVLVALALLLFAYALTRLLLRCCRPRSVEAVSVLDYAVRYRNLLLPSGALVRVPIQ